MSYFAILLVDSLRTIFTIKQITIKINTKMIEIQNEYQIQIRLVELVIEKIIETKIYV